MSPIMLALLTHVLPDGRAAPPRRATASSPVAGQPLVSEPCADAEDWSVLEHVELVALAALALDIVDIKRPVSDDAREGDALVGAELESVSADGLPGELASNPEPADVAAQEEFMARRH